MSGTLPAAAGAQEPQAAETVGAGPTRPDVEACCRRVLRDFLPEPIGERALDAIPLADLEIDSLRLAELLVALEEEFDIALPRGTITRDGTLAQLADAIRTRLDLGTGAGAASTTASTTCGLPGARADAPPRTLSAMLETAARRGGALTWIDDRDRASCISYAALRRAACQVAAALRHLGVRAGDRVGIVASEGDEFVPVFFGTVWCGAIAVPLAPPPGFLALPGYVAGLETRLAQVRPALLVLDSTVAPLLAPLLACVPTVPATQLLAAAPPQAAAAVRAEAAASALCAPVAAGTATAALDEPGADDPAALALLQFSSGTGGAAKPVALAHRHLLANMAAAAARARMTEQDRFVSWLPLFHDMGLIGGVLTPIACGASAVLMSPLRFLKRPETWLRAIADTRATVGLAPNFGYAYAARRIPRGACLDLDLSCWRLAWNGAETVRPSVVHAFAARFAAVGFRATAMYPTYGLAEASLCVTCAVPGTGVRIERVDRVALRRGRAVPAAADGDAVAIVGAGHALPGFEVRIAGTAERAAAGAEVGEILVRGPSVMAGYFGDREASAAALRDGWLRTGDLGYLHDGDLFVCGRIKETVILRGVNYHAVELEAVVDEAPGVRAGRSVVFTEPGPTGETDLVVVAEIRLEAAADVVRAAIARCFRARLGIVPARVVLVPPRSLPITTSGKLKRNACRDRYARHGRPAPVESVGWSGLAWRALRRLTGRIGVWAAASDRPGADLPVDV